MADWQPISTAPKDGTRFLAFERHGEPSIYECWWRDGGDESYWTDYADSEPNPTHWAHLPEPPQDANPQPEDFPHGLRVGDTVRRLATYRGGPDAGKETILRATYPVGSLWQVVDVNKYNVFLFDGGHWWPDAYGFELVERPKNDT